MRQLYPPHLLEDSLEQHLARHAARGRPVYSTLLLALGCALALLPVVRVSVSVRGQGLIRPITEKHEARSRVSGVVERVLVREGQIVRAGDAMAVVRASGVEAQARLLRSRASEEERTIADIERLTARGNPEPASSSGFLTSRYREEFIQLSHERSERALAVERAERELARARELLERRFAAPSEVEARELELARARAEWSLVAQRARSRWESELGAARMRLEELRSRLQELGEERALYTVRAPVGGTVEQVTALSPGSFLQAGEQLAIISPDTTLVADIYVTPRDIGLLRVGTVARLLVDAFDYNVWGVVPARVTQISDDFILLDRRPVFKVRCELERHELTLPNGVRGALRKGMTLQARFLIARRSLLQLIHDDLSSWLDPVRSGAGAEPPLIPSTATGA
jgi:HlyD family secretion protein